MAAFGLKVQELLRVNGKDAAWLAVRTGISNSTISNWLTDPDVQPKPSSVEKVAAAPAANVNAPLTGAALLRKQLADAEAAEAAEAAATAAAPVEAPVEPLVETTSQNVDDVLAELNGI